MSYYSNSPPANSLAFPSFGQQNLQPNSSVSEMQHHFNRQILPSADASKASGDNDRNAIASAGSIGNTQDSSANALTSENGTAPEVSISENEGKPMVAESRGKRERKNKPGHKFGAKKKSWVWSWFVQDTGDSSTAACDYCGKLVKRMPSDKGSPKKLSEHLRTHKLNKNSINTARSIPVDGNGILYNTSGGIPMPYSSSFNQHIGNSGGQMHSLQMQQNSPGMRQQQSASPSQLSDQIQSQQIQSQQIQSQQIQNQQIQNQQIQSQQIQSQQIQSQQIQSQQIQSQQIQSQQIQNQQNSKHQIQKQQNSKHQIQKQQNSNQQIQKSQIQKQQGSSQAIPQQQQEQQEQQEQHQQQNHQQQNHQQQQQNHQQQHQNQPQSHHQNHHQNQNHQPQSHHQNHQNHHHQLIQPQQSQLRGLHKRRRSEELSSQNTKYRRATSMQAVSADNSTQSPLQGYASQLSSPITTAKYPRRPVASLDYSPYSATAFHRHLLKFLVDNKLPIRVLSSPSFQQVVCDLRSESVNDLLELTSLYSSFMEVSRAEESDEMKTHASIAEASVVNTLAQELIKK